MDEFDNLTRQLYGMLDVAALALEHARQLARQLYDDDRPELLDTLAAGVEEVRDSVDLGS